MLRVLLLTLASFFLGAVPAAAAAQPKGRPNVVVILTDDQGHGDLGFHGNPKIKTPNIDKFARQSARFKYFYVSPVCSPTRASIMTGRYNYRTGVVDTFLGRSMMDPDEVTLAQMLAAAGYRTGIFGKWHLGDHFPLRPMDRGFHEALTLKGGGIGQPSDPPTGNSYFDPVLDHNGKEVQKKGYCSDIFTDAAIDFMQKTRDGPFFVYLTFNCPHTPLQVPDKYYQMYKNVNLDPAEFPKVGHPVAGKVNQDETAKIYGMITNIDDNIGRLLAALDELKLAENTIVIFLTDNGPQQPRWNSGLLMRKGSVHEGGVRVPCFVRWPAQLPGDRDIDRIAAHIDLAPTLLDACGVAAPKKVQFDGKSLVPLLRGDKVDWPDRTLYVQWHRGDEPELYRAFAARSQKWRLVQPEGATAKLPAKVTFKLYDMEKDPFEEHDVAAQHPDVVTAMKKGYEAWFKDVSATRGYAPPRIFLGAKEENPVLLTRQDWRGPRAGWGPKDLGYWEVKVAREGKYDVALLVAPSKMARVVHLRLGGKELKTDLPAEVARKTFAGVEIPEGPGRLEAWIQEGDQTLGVLYVEVRRLE
jgi:arylsulfatase A-like enzyme